MRVRFADIAAVHIASQTDAMRRLTQIAEALEVSGWSIVQSELPSDCWWAKEIWELRSEWSPKGMVIFLSLLIDPAAEVDDNNPPESAVWAISITRNFPQSRLDAEDVAISIKRRMGQATVEVVKVASEMRVAN